MEDAAELSPAHPHVAALQTRVSNVEGAGAVSLADLVRQALRMRPDRLVVGEVRGVEVVDLTMCRRFKHRSRNRKDSPGHGEGTTSDLYYDLMELVDGQTRVLSLSRLFASDLRKLHREREETRRALRRLSQEYSHSRLAIARALSKAVLDEVRRLRRKIRSLNSEIRRLLAITAFEFLSTEITRTLRHTVDSHRTRGPDSARKTSSPQVLREFALT